MLTDKLNNFRIHKHWVEVFQGRNWREDTSDHIWPTRALQLFPGQPAAAAALSASSEPMAASAALVPHLSLKLCHTHVAICLLDSISQVLKFNTSKQNSSLPAHPQLRPDPPSFHFTRTPSFYMVGYNFCYSRLKFSRHAFLHVIKKQKLTTHTIFF